MVTQQITQFAQLLDRALDADDIDGVRKVSSGCEQYLRQHLPVVDRHGEDLSKLADELEGLLVIYRRALDLVEKAKMEAGSQLQNIGRNRSNTHKYLDIARDLGA